MDGEKTGLYNENYKPTIANRKDYSHYEKVFKGSGLEVIVTGVVVGIAPAAAGAGQSQEHGLLIACFERRDIVGAEVQVPRSYGYVARSYRYRPGLLRRLSSARSSAPRPAHLPPPLCRAVLVMIGALVFWAARFMLLRMGGDLNDFIGSAGLRYQGIGGHHLPKRRASIGRAYQAKKRPRALCCR